MKILNEHVNNPSVCNKFPCNKCMSYVTADMKQKSALINDDKRKILFYLQKINDRDIIREIADLLRNISAQY